MCRGCHAQHHSLSDGKTKQACCESLGLHSSTASGTLVSAVTTWVYHVLSAVLLVILILALPVLTQIQVNVWHNGKVADYIVQDGFSVPSENKEE